MTLLDAGTVRTLADVLRVQADEIDLQSIALTSNGVEVGPDSTPAPKPPNPVGTEKAVSLLLSDPGVQEVRARVEAAETELGMELQAHRRPFQDRYDQAVRERRRGPAHQGLSGQARPLGTDLRLACRSRDLDRGTALGPQQRGPADRVGGQRT
ncbi:hypothetical protein [Streptomyces sp. NPDC056921]|uniref:hypothetical protein n=1 Tax=Streptomyces sp. NPDC056921 TaxID=3345966 RepID=UPI00362E4DA3